jgi:hypothetical protein
VLLTVRLFIPCVTVLLFVSHCFALSWPGRSCKWELVLNWPTWLNKGEVKKNNEKCLTNWKGILICNTVRFMYSSLYIFCIVVFIIINTKKYIKNINKWWPHSFTSPIAKICIILTREPSDPSNNGNTCAQQLETGKIILANEREGTSVNNTQNLTSFFSKLPECHVHPHILVHLLKLKHYETSIWSKSTSNLTLLYTSTQKRFYLTRTDCGWSKCSCLDLILICLKNVTLFITRVDTFTCFD